MFGRAFLEKSLGKNMNKKGFIRTVEAVIAIVILLGLVLTIFGDKKEEVKKTPEVVEDALNYITSELLYNKVFRDCFTKVRLPDNNKGGKCSDMLASVATCSQTINAFLSSSVPPGYSSHCEVCKTTRSCSTLPNLAEDKSVYPKSIFMYTKIDDKEEARVVRIYIF